MGTLDDPSPKSIRKLLAGHGSRRVRRVRRVARGLFMHIKAASTSGAKLFYVIARSGETSAVADVICVYDTFQNLIF